MQQHYMFLDQHIPIHECSVFLIANVEEAHCYKYVSVHAKTRLRA